MSTAHDLRLDWRQMIMIIFILTLSAAIAASTPDTLASAYEEIKNGYGKNISIVRSTSACVSLIASLLLIWIMNRSRSRFTTTYHRLILGMSIFDILSSTSQATFGLINPAEMSYLVWNARGNLATCDAFGFMQTMGTVTSIMYSASLNLYYLAKIKYNKPDSYIARKLEPLLHAVPILFGLVMMIIIVTQEGMNNGNSAACSFQSYNPPHCDGFEDGEVPNGFEIPCGRGNSFYKGLGAPLTFVIGVMTVLIVPIIMGGSLFMIYRSISRQERRMVRYGERALGGDDAGPNDGVTSVSSIMTSITRSIRSRFGGGSGSRNQDSSQSRAVSSRAAAYSISYFATYGWAIVAFTASEVGAWPTEIPLPTWAVTYEYFWNFFLPLQGLWTLLIFMHPKVAHHKRNCGRDISWTSAFLDVLWLAATGRKRREDAAPCATDETHGTRGTTARSGVGVASVATPGVGGNDASPTAEEATKSQGGVNTRRSPEPRAFQDAETDGTCQNEGAAPSPDAEGASGDLHV